MVDERPKPKYGELAPEGWSWTPPAPAANDSDVPAPVADAAPYSAPPQPYPAPEPYSNQALPTSMATPKPVNTVDVAVTSLLLFVGVLLSASMLPSLFDFNTVLIQAAAMQGYGSFAPSAAANTAGVVAGVVTILLQVLAIVIGVRRLQRRKLAFPFVLGFGILAFAVWVAAITFAFFNDPTFMQQVMSSTKV
jgi:hypothetical protein